jgi:hypothetical protein
MAAVLIDPTTKTKKQTKWSSTELPRVREERHILHTITEGKLYG